MVPGRAPPPRCGRCAGRTSPAVPQGGLDPAAYSRNVGLCRPIASSGGPRSAFRSGRRPLFRAVPFVGWPRSFPWNLPLQGALAVFAPWRPRVDRALPDHPAATRPARARPALHGARRRSARPPPVPGPSWRPPCQPGGPASAAGPVGRSCGTAAAAPSPRPSPSRSAPLGPRLAARTEAAAPPTGGNGLPASSGIPTNHPIRQPAPAMSRQGE